MSGKKLFINCAGVPLDVKAYRRNADIPIAFNMQTATHKFLNYGHESCPYLDVLEVYTNGKLIKILDCKEESVDKEINCNDTFIFLKETVDSELELIVLNNMWYLDHMSEIPIYEANVRSIFNLIKDEMPMYSGIRYNDTCPICLDPAQIVFSCGHAYCQKCTLQCLARNIQECSLCKHKKLRPKIYKINSVN